MIVQRGGRQGVERPATARSHHQQHRYIQAETQNCSANFMTWPIPAILCRPSYFIFVLHFIAGLVSSGVSRPYLTLSLLSLRPVGL